MAKEKDKILDTDKNLVMADRRKQISRLYGGSDAALGSLFGKKSGNTQGQRFTEEELERILSNVGGRGAKKSDYIDLGRYAYATEPAFKNIIDYLSNMFMWRYYYFPVKIKETADTKAYGEIYELMTSIVDGLALETTMPEIIGKLLREGSIFLYAMKNTSSKTVSTIMLNPNYCRPVLMSQYGTGVFQFDVTYFDSLKIETEELEEVLKMFPDELAKAYLEYKLGRGKQWILADGRYSTYILVNEDEFPSYLSTLRGIFDYDEYRRNEVDRNSAQLDVLLTHKIPSYENRLLFELPEVQSLHKSMSQAIGRNPRVRLMTTFGDVQLHQLQDSDKVSVEVLEKAQEAIYDSAGLNSNIFVGETDKSLELALTKDQSFVWKYIQQIMSYYNLAINNLFNFRGYQAELTMLPITHYNQEDMMEMYRRGGEYGLSRLEAIVASGTKQRHLTHKATLEDFLKLDEILKPLSSSHTQSGKEELEKEEKESIKETTNPVEPDDISISSGEDGENDSGEKK